MRWTDRREERARRVVMFVAALSGTVYEAAWREAERPFLLSLYAAMMGFPFVLGRADKPPSPPEPES